MFRLYSKIILSDSLGLLKNYSFSSNPYILKQSFRNLSHFSFISYSNSSTVFSNNDKTRNSFSSDNSNSKSTKSSGFQSFSNVNISKTLSVKDLDWISSKIAENEQPKTDKTHDIKKNHTSKEVYSNQTGFRKSDSFSKKTTNKKDYMKNYADKWGKPVETTRFNKELPVKNNLIYEATLTENSELSEKTIPSWKIRKEELAKKLNGEHWKPVKRLSRPAMDRIRFLAKEFPEEWTFTKLSAEFRISFDAVRRIVTCKYRPPEEYIQKQEEKRKSNRLEFIRNLKASSKACNNDNQTSEFFSAALSLKTDSLSNDEPSRPRTTSDHFLQKNSSSNPRHPRTPSNPNSSQKISHWKPQGSFEGWDKL